jgi:excisionase family DNA binding protein
MAASQSPQLSIVSSQDRSELTDSASELPMNVKEAAKFLGVSPQTVYLWVERKQIPHLRVMVEISGSSDRISNRFALHFDRRW